MTPSRPSAPPPPSAAHTWYPPRTEVPQNHQIRLRASYGGDGVGGFVGEGGERERARTGHETFALHTFIQWAIWGDVIKSRSGSNAPQRPPASICCAYMVCSPEKNCLLSTWPRKILNRLQHNTAKLLVHTTTQLRLTSNIEEFVNWILLPDTLAPQRPPASICCAYMVLLLFFIALKPRVE